MELFLSLLTREGFGSVPNRIAFPATASHSKLNMKASSAKSAGRSVSCPACGVIPGQWCLLQIGGRRTESHLGRRLKEIESVETEKNHHSEKLSIGRRKRR